MRKMAKIIVVILLLFISGGVAAGVVGYMELAPVSKSDVARVSFQIPKHQTIDQIGKRLQDAGLIRQALAFRFVVWQKRLDGKIQAGSFLLSPSMSVADIAQQLTTGTNQVWVTTIEGWRVEEIADMLAEQNLANFDKQAFLDLAKKNEGYLFPDSYLIQKDTTADVLYSLFTNTFQKKVVQGLSTELAQSGRPLKDVINMASIVQREAKDPDQMKMIAGILWNRDKAGVGLNVDSTLQYMKGYDPVLKTWWQEPLAADKESTSLFNTYKYKGLPPAPIDNPGLDAIRAAAQPTPSNFMFYIHDRQGNAHYAVTLEEQNANVQKYLRN